MHQIRTILFCTAIALCVTVGDSAGQPDRPTASKVDMDKAKNHYHRAQSYKRLGEYQKAAEEFLKAYELYQDAEFYFNAAEMYRLAGDRDRAVEYFKKYLVAHPDGRVSQAAKASVEELTSEMVAAQARRAQEDAAKEEAARDQRDKAAREQKGAAPARPETELERGSDEDAEPDSERPSGKSFKLAGMASGAVGFLSLALGAKYGLDASSTSDELSVKYDPQTEKDGAAAEQKMFIFYGVGAAALIAGGVLYYIGHGRSSRAERARTVSVTPHLDGDRVTLWVKGRF